MSAEPQRLHPDDLEVLAALVAAHLAERLEAPRPAERLLTAAEVAERLGVRRDLVYARAEELGAVRLGDGPRGRLRFDPAKVAEALASRDGSRRSPLSDLPAPAGVRRRRRESSPAPPAQRMPARPPRPVAEDSGG